MTAKNQTPSENVNGKELANVKSALTTGALADVTDWESALKILAQAGIVPDSFSDYGDGFTVVDQARLVGVPFIIMEWRFNPSKLSDTGFVSAGCVTKNGDKWVINDGGTGIRQQLEQVTAQRIAKGHDTPQNGLVVPAGLVQSDYEWEDNDGKMKPGTTFYLSGSPVPVL